LAWSGIGQGQLRSNNLTGFAAATTNREYAPQTQTDKSFFASFFSKKEALPSCPPIR
jgi:hypothetical protein